MDVIFKNDLLLNEVDVEGALSRLSGDSDVYVLILSAFPKDTAMIELEKALDIKDWDAAFTAVHALKGVAGNLGLVKLFHSLGELVILIRAGKLKEIDESFRVVKRNYIDIVRVIETHCVKQEEDNE